MTGNGNSREGEEILRQMAAIRGNLHHEVEGITESARTMTDWHYYVGAYPWACVGAAVALGYLAVPAKLQIVSPDPDTLLKLAKKNRLTVTPNPEPQRRGGIIAPMFTLAANMLVRGLLAYAGQQAGKFMGYQAADETPDSVRRP